MEYSKQNIKENLHYLNILSRQYPTIQAAATEIINLQAILNLPKGTEHFMSDLHGEYEAFNHILNNASGVIREKVDLLYSNTMASADRAALASLIYYPEAKLEAAKRNQSETEEWYRLTLNRLIEVCKLVASKYTRSKVRKTLPKDYAYILDELLHTNYDEHNKEQYYANIISTIIDIGQGDRFVIALCETIKRLVVDRLHIVGDVFDRGPRADIIMDDLLAHHSVDFQWGNHDILWMGAATGSRTCIANVLNNSITYHNLEMVETGYGINLRPLALFANEVYENVDISCFLPKNPNHLEYTSKDIQLAARMHKAIAIIQFKLEGQIIQRHPEFGMEERLLLDKIDYENRTVTIGGVAYPLKDCDFPTVDREHPYRLSAEEAELMEQLKFAFLQSEKLQRHARFLYTKGRLYQCYNENLLFHGCIPMEEDGSFMEFQAGGQKLSGKAYMDYCDAMARQGYYARHGSRERREGQDYLWYLWCGKNSPLFGRLRMASFERLLVEDSSTWTEPKNAYYRLNESEEVCARLLREFGLQGQYSHIINGHMPVRSKDGESPLKAHGKLIVIDGGFCRAYQPTTGIAGYTLIYNSYGIRLIAHEPFESAQAAINRNTDILSTEVVFETAQNRLKMAQTDEGRKIQSTIQDLKLLLAAYESGLVSEQHLE